MTSAGDQQPPKDTSRAQGLDEAIGDIALDHEKVEVAAVVRIPARS